MGGSPGCLEEVGEWGGGDVICGGARGLPRGRGPIRDKQPQSCQGRGGWAGGERRALGWYGPASAVGRF